MKKMLLYIFVILLCLGLGISIGMIVNGNQKNNNNDNNSNDTKTETVINPRPDGALEELDKKYEKDYTYEIVDNYFVAYKYDKGSQKYHYLNSFLCGEGCEIASYVHFTYENLDKGLVVVTSSDYRNYLFDFNKGLLGVFDYIESLEIGNEYKYFVVGNDDYTSLLTLDGKELYKLKGELTDTTIAGNEGLDAYMYSINDDLIVYKENDKFGLLKLSTGDKIIPAEFEYLRLIYYGNNKFNTDFVKVKENNKWYVYNIKSKEKSINTGYDQILTIYNNTLVVEDNKNIYFKDLLGNNIINESIKVNKSFDDIDWDWEFLTDDISFKIEDNYIYILDSIYKENLYYSFEDDYIEEDGITYNNILDYISKGGKNIKAYQYDIKSKKITSLN